MFYANSFPKLADQLWLEYAQFSVGGMNLPGGVEKIRDVNERAISAVGLHWRKGNAIWELYRECENAFLTTIQVQSLQVPIM